MKKYTIGVDYGTLSGRAVLVEVDTGNIVATAVKDYKHGVMEHYLPDLKTKLGHDFALQHPTDYLEVLSETIPLILKESKIDSSSVVGVGIDFTACTVLPVNQDLKPLCLQERHESNPHAYVKLWKHHAAQKEANLLNQIAEERGEKFLARYGGKISSEWAIPKIWEILNKAPNIYEEMDNFVEAGDWVVAQLTGKLARNSCAAGFKGLWHKVEGYPSTDFFKSLDPRLEFVIKEKFKGTVYPLGSKAGEITKEGAKLTGLLEGTPVGVANIDAHVAAPAVGLTKPGQYLMIMGTSTCNMLVTKEEILVPGISGVVEDGVIPGFMGYESGQACVGDHFDWFIKNNVPKNYFEEAQKKGLNIHELLTEKAANLTVGESGLLALDWWNGNRSTLVDSDLTGMIVGMTLQTKPEEIYRALIEATAYGARKIIEAFKDSGVEVNEVFACGGLAQKSPFLMQVYSDVFNMDIKIADSTQTPALGAALYGAVAAGSQRGGYDSIAEASEKMAKVKEGYYQPIAENAHLYEELFDEYTRLYHYFGCGENNVMKTLKKIKISSSKMLHLKQDNKKGTEDLSKVG